MRRLSATVLRDAIAREHFAVLATHSDDGSPHSAGVTYSAVVEDERLVLYVMSRRHLRKARDVERAPRVSLVIPVPRPILTFLPPATIQLSGRAELLPQDSAAGLAAFRRFMLGRRIIASYQAMRLNGEMRVCFIRIVVDPVVRSYMVGTGIVQAARHMESAAATGDLGARQEPAVV